MGITSRGAVEGFVSRGGDAPVWDPNAIVIVGHDVPMVDALWWASCPRLDEELRELAEEQAGRLTPAADDVSLASIREHGVLDPVDVCRLRVAVRAGERLLHPGTMILLAGRRRVLRARVVWNGQTHVPIAGRKGSVRLVIRQGEPHALFRFNRLENARKNLRPEHRAEQAKILLAHLPGDDADPTVRIAKERQVATEMAVDLRTIQNWLAIDKVVPELKEAITRGVEVNGQVKRFPVSKAPDVARLPEPEQREVVKQWAEEGAPKTPVLTKQLSERKKGAKAPRREEVRRIRPPGVFERLAIIAEAGQRSKGCDAQIDAFGVALVKALGGDDKAIDDLPADWQGWFVQAQERPGR